LNSRYRRSVGVQKTVFVQQFNCRYWTHGDGLTATRLQETFTGIDQSFRIHNPYLNTWIAASSFNTPCTPPESLHFSSHFSRLTWVSQYQNVSILDLTGAKDDGDGDNWSYKTCKAPVTMTNQHAAFFTGQMLFLSPNQQQCQSTEGKALPQNTDTIHPHA